VADEPVEPADDSVEAADTSDESTERVEAAVEDPEPEFEVRSESGDRAGVSDESVEPVDGLDEAEEPFDGSPEAAQPCEPADRAASGEPVDPEDDGPLPRHHPWEGLTPLELRPSPEFHDFLDQRHAEWKTALDDPRHGLEPSRGGAEAPDPLGPVEGYEPLADVDERDSLVPVEGPEPLGPAEESFPPSHSDSDPLRPVEGLDGFASERAVPAGTPDTPAPSEEWDAASDRAPAVVEQRAALAGGADHRAPSTTEQVGSDRHPDSGDEPVGADRHPESGDEPVGADRHPAPEHGTDEQDEVDEPDWRDTVRASLDALAHEATPEAVAEIVKELGAAGLDTYLVKQMHELAPPVRTQVEYLLNKAYKRLRRGISSAP
jgi:hypothetical protein